MESYIEMTVSSSSIDDKRHLAMGEAASSKNGHVPYSLVIPFNPERPPSGNEKEMYRQKLIGVAYKAARKVGGDKLIYVTLNGFKSSGAIQVGVTDQTMHVAIQFATDTAIGYLNEFISNKSTGL